MKFVQYYLDCLSQASYLVGDETHVHADFLSGHLELAAATGAAIIYGAAADVHFPHRKVTDGERVELGQVGLEFRATPGHTPESICIVVWETPDASTPYGVLTGDTLFIGDVGRPDLVAAQGRSPEEMAAELYRSLHTRVLTLPDTTRVYPAHGAGSACGKNLSTDPRSRLACSVRPDLPMSPTSSAATRPGRPRRPDLYL